MNRNRRKLLSNHYIMIQSQFFIKKSYFHTISSFEGRFGLIPAVLNSKSPLYKVWISQLNFSQWQFLFFFIA